MTNNETYRYCDYDKNDRKITQPIGFNATTNNNHLSVFCACVLRARDNGRWQANSVRMKINALKWVKFSCLLDNYLLFIIDGNTWLAKQSSKIHEMRKMFIQRLLFFPSNSFETKKSLSNVC